MPLVYALIDVDVAASSSELVVWKDAAGESLFTPGTWSARLTCHDPITRQICLQLDDESDVEASIAVDEDAGTIELLFPAGTPDASSWTRDWAYCQVTAWPDANPEQAVPIAAGIVRLQGLPIAALPEPVPAP